MSNKTRLQTNNNNLDVCIAKANSLPNAGGGSIETCTVKITFDQSLSSVIHFAYSSIDEEGKIYSTVLYNPNYVGSIQSLVVPCGSLIYINASAIQLDYMSLSGGLTNLFQRSSVIIFQAPTVNGATGTVTIYDGD